ncbi:MAG TPA: M14 metallopeptidase family protein [Vicinamibacterales bacterium]|nr:M14 metallopeptidase family protein [Vicinamibacterales bacterium]
MLTRILRPAVLACAAILIAVTAAAQTVTAPKQHFGFNIGDDYQLATYTQLVEYWRKLDKESDRMTVVEIGKTAEGRPQLMAIITSPENHKRLDRYKQIARQLALAEGLTDEQARALAREGKAVVWFDGGLHATEVLGAHQLMETVYQLVSRTDAETTRFLNDLVILAVHANPDGMELVSNWYMRNPDPKQRSSGGIPRLYQKYIGHDNNRDFYMSAQPESTNMNRVLYHQWFPQIVYNHHQTGPAGTVMFAPPFRDPFNYNFDPLVPAQLDLVGAAMHSRFAAEGKPGVTSRRGASYSTWWNGGLRTTVYFHNMIGLLTETIGNPTPVNIPFLPNRHLPDSNLHFPIEPQTWHFRQSIDYSVTANYAVFDIASRNKENFLYNIYQMGKNSIERGSQDSWTPTPRRVIAAQAAVGGRGGRGGGAAAAGGDEQDAPTGGGGRGGRGGRGGTVEDFRKLLRDPQARDPRGFILPADQPDFPTATKFVNALIKTGVTVHRATAPFSVSGKSYPAGSWIVKSAQAFRPHVLDMFEPQDHPDDIPYPGGPPTRPYDSAGWTLAYQMGVKFDRVLEGFDGPFERVEGLQKAPAGKVEGTAGAGYTFSHATNDSFIAINRLIAAGEEVSWITSGPQRGLFFVAQKPSTTALVSKIAADIGIGFNGVAARPSGEAMQLRRLRIALADQYGGSMPSGWTRWLLEQFEFPFEVVYPKALEVGGLASRYDVIIFPSGVGPSTGGGGRGGGGRGGSPANIPAEYDHMVGAYTAAQTAPPLRKFVEDGGTILAVGRSAMSFAQLFELPVGNHLIEKAPDGTTRQLPSEKFYIPGSVLSMAVDTTAPIAQGITNPVDIFFDNSPVFSLDPDAMLKGIRPVAWFDKTATPLRSGWAYGQGYLEGGVQVVDASVGRGRLFLFAPEITFRAQPHGTFKFLFNGIYLAARQPGSGTTTDSAKK